jgi:hypothetical protein
MSKSWGTLNAVVIASLFLCGNAASATESDQRSTRACTIAVPATWTSIEVEIPNAADFCELVSQALGAEVFHTPLFVMPGHLFHYTGEATASCQLRYRRTTDRLTIRNSQPACRWFRKRATGWHPDRTQRKAVA